MAKNKQYVAKFFDKNGTFIKLLKPLLLENEINFNSKINGGQSEVVLNIRADEAFGMNGFDDFGEYETSFEFLNFVKIFEIETGFETGRLIYTGFVSKIIPFVNAANEGVQITILGLASLLTLSLFKDGANFDVVYSTPTDPAQIIKDVIDDFNSVYPGNWLSYSGGGVQTVGTNVTVTFEKNNWFQVIEKSRELAGGGWFWRIDPDGQIYFDQKPGSATHEFTLSKNVDSMNIDTNSEKVTNDVTVEWASGTVSSNDATSISKFGKRERYVFDVGIDDSTAAQQRADQIVADFKDEKLRVTMVINNDFDIETIKNGQTCKVRGLKKGSVVLSNNMQIVSISYSPDRASLSLEEFVNFSDEIKNLEA